MKTLFIATALFFSAISYGQINKITLQASGLTCSMCSNAINKSIKSLDFVDRVTANIKTSSFDISIKPGSKPNFDQIKKKVEDAGFSVAKLTASMHFNGETLEKDKHIMMNGMVFHFLNAGNLPLTGDHTIQVVDKGYVSAKEFKKNQLYTSMECYKTGVAGDCCTKAGTAKGSRIFHVTI